MEKFKKLISWLVDQSTFVKILAIVALICCAVAFLFSSCSVAKTSLSGDKVLNKHVRDSTHYEIVVEK